MHTVTHWQAKGHTRSQDRQSGGLECKRDPKVGAKVESLSAKGKECPIPRLPHQQQTLPSPVAAESVLGVTHGHSLVLWGGGGGKTSEERISGQEGI